MTPTRPDMSWRSWFDPSVWFAPGGRSDETPTVRLLGHATVDEMVLAAFRRRAESFSDEHVDELATAAELSTELCDRLGWFDDPTLAFEPATPPSEDEVETKSARSGPFRYRRARFPSEYTPHPDDPTTDRWQTYERNRLGHVWFMHHDEPRPWVVCVHGTGMGRALADLGLFRANWLHQRLGLNVAVPVLPFHGPRSEADDTVAYPSEDVLTNFHATLQAVSDVRRTIAWIRSMDGSVPVALHGISLGGYVSAIVASTEADLACVLLGAPLANLTTLIEGHLGPRATDAQLACLVLGARLSTIVSPLRHDLAIPSHRVTIYAGRADRMVPPDEHALALWTHWGEPKALWFEGGHAALGRSREVGKLIGETLEDAGVRWDG